jgi:hypothetical protein
MAGLLTPLTCLTQVLTFTTITKTEGQMPYLGTPYAFLIDKNTAFNSDGTDVINVGYSGATTAYLSAFDVSTVGAASSVLPNGTGAGTGLGRREGTAQRDIIWTYVPGGSAATTGVVFIHLFFIPFGTFTA